MRAIRGGGFQHMSRNSKTGRFLALDALRGLAALGVLVFHYTTIATDFITVPDPPKFHFRAGYFGVELFFMISGFVILMSLEKTRSWREFAIARIARLYPAFWAGLAFTFLLGVAAPLQGQALTVADLAVNASMVPAWLKWSEIDPVYWTLAYEAGFYCTMAMLAASGRLRQIDFFAAVWLALSVAFILWPRLVPHPLHYLMTINDYTHLFVFGVMVWRIRSVGANALRLSVMAGALAVTLLRLEPWELACEYFVAAIFLLAAFGKLEKIAIRPLLFLGAISYPLYLIHQIAGYRVIEALSDYGFAYPVAASVAASVMIAISAAIHYAIEKPGERTLKNFARSRLQLSSVS